jgi:outer membrane receptor protein involved in Fe transport
MFMPKPIWIKAIVGLSLTMVAVFAQSERGTISGSVKDPSGAVVAGAKVVVSNSATNVAANAVTSDSGDFTVPSLPAGAYVVRVEKEGFRPAVVTGVTVNAASDVRADVTLEIGTTSTAVEVQAVALQLATENAKTSATVTNALVDQLPLVVSGTLRSPFDLATLTPEAKQLGGDNGFMLGGGQAASYGTNLDGVSANTTRALSQSWVATNAPSLEAVTEFTVDTNGFKAEFGHAGGGVMNFVSKSGSNTFHGSAYEFIRNNAFDANNFFNNREGIPIPVYKQHDFGGSFGGPVWLPKIYHGKDKTFFFVSYEAFRNRAGATGFTQSIPTPEMYQGDFSNWVDKNGHMIPIYDPTTQVKNPDGSYTRQPFAGNQIPASQFDSLSVKALQAYTANGILKPNNGAAPGTIGYVQNNYIVSNGTNVSPNTKISVKGDHLFNERHRISGYYGYNRQSIEPGPSGPPTLPGLYSTYNDLTQASDVVRFSWDWTFGPTKLNHFYAGGNNWRQGHDPLQATVKSGIHWKDKVCLQNVPDCDQNLLNFDFSDLSSWGGRANNGSENTIYSFNDDFTWIRNSHSIKFGGAYQLSHYNGFGRQCISGCATFSYINTGVPGGNDPLAGGSSFASLLLGYANGGSIDTIRFIGQQWPAYAGYIQDDWRVSSKLTVNYGLRWETALPPKGLDDKWSDFSPTTPNPGAGGILGALIYAGTGQGRQGSRTLADSWYGGFGPRVGLAYQWNDRTVIRTSYGRSFGAVTTVTGSTHQRGFTQTFGVPDNGTNGILPNMILSAGFPSYPVPPFIDPSFANKDNIPWWQGHEATRLPEQNFWNFSIQRQLSSSMILEASYNAVIGSHLQSQLLNYDQVNPADLTQYGFKLMNSLITSPAAVAAGFASPYPTFTDKSCPAQSACWGSGATVARSLRPYPQYAGIDTYSGGGDHSGHSSYHAAILRLERRYSSGLTIQTSYVFSKLLTDSDTYWGSGQAMDQFNRRLEKSIGQFDITHNFKFSGIYELPFGKGKRWMANGFASHVLGNWRISGIAFYSSGQPLPLYTTVGTPSVFFAGPNRPLISTYDGWRAPTKGGSFDPSVDTFVQPASFFPAQVGTEFSGTTQYFGDMTRYNPKFRQFPNLNENLSITKGFYIGEHVHADFRAEAFNVFNRVRFGTGSLTIQSSQFGVLTSSGDLLNTPRQMQLALKLYF